MLRRCFIQLFVWSWLLTIVASPTYAELDYPALLSAVVHIQADRGSFPGAGCVVKIEGNRGYILTAYHVIKKAVEEGRQQVEVKFHRTAETFEAHINPEWIQVENDLAVIEISDMPMWHSLPLGNTTELGIRDEVIAIGHPLGVSWAVTGGKVSRFTGRDIIFSTDDSTDDAVDRGNSGGPLLDTQGRLVGMNLHDLGKFVVAIQIDVIKPILNRWIGSLSEAVIVTPLASVIRGQDHKEMALVKAGWFEMGSTLGDDDEKPVHRVWLDGFYMDKFEVTVGEYKAFIQEAKHRSLSGLVAIYAPGDQYPVVHVSWNDARRYCEWAGKTLSTEAQWEKAAQGTDGREYPWGNMEVDRKRANYCSAKCRLPWPWSNEEANDGHVYTSPVGTYERGVSPYGIYDLAGNVREWVLDWYDEGYYSHSPKRNPVNGQKSDFRVLRGGGWNDQPADLRAANRARKAPTSRHLTVGFRCVQAATPKK